MCPQQCILVYQGLHDWFWFYSRLDEKVTRIFSGSRVVWLMQSNLFSTINCSKETVQFSKVGLTWLSFFVGLNDLVLEPLRKLFFSSPVYVKVSQILRFCFSSLSYLAPFPALVRSLKRPEGGQPAKAWGIVISLQPAFPYSLQFYFKATVTNIIRFYCFHSVK